MHRLGWLGALLVVLGVSACGTRAPSSPGSWLSASLDVVDGRDTSARFRMWIQLEREEDGIATRLQLERRGEASSRDIGRFRIEAETQADLYVNDELVSSGMIRDTQIGDGEQRWLSIARPDGQPPAVLAHALDGAVGEQDDPLTQSAAPIDLDPLALLRLYAEYADWVEELASEKRYVVLIGSMTEELDAEIARLGSGYRPREIRLSLDRDSALPIELEIIDDGHDQGDEERAKQKKPTVAMIAGKLKIRYLAWTIDSIADSQFTAPATAERGGQ